MKVAVRKKNLNKMFFIQKMKMKGRGKPVQRMRIINLFIDKCWDILLTGQMVRLPWFGDLRIIQKKIPESRGSKRMMSKENIAYYILDDKLGYKIEFIPLWKPKGRVIFKASAKRTLQMQELVRNGKSYISE